VRSAPFTWRRGARIFGLSLKTKVDGLSWFDLKTIGTVFSGLASKPVQTVSPGLASKLVMSFLVEPQNQCGAGFPTLGLKTNIYGLVIWVSKSPRRFGGLGLKISATVFWFRPQNQADFGLSVVPQNCRREVGTGQASRSSGLLLVEASRARVSQSGLKTGRDSTTGGPRGTIMEVASEVS
jgi:hypothetical protein